jgi:hypothetical protein
MKYICVNRIHIIEYKNCKCTSKLRLWVEFCNDFFGGEWYWCTSIKFKTIEKFIILVENQFKECVFLHFLNNKCIINSYFSEKTIILRKQKDFKSEHCIFFHFSLVWYVSWTTNIRPYGYWKDVGYILYAHWFYPYLFI